MNGILDLKTCEKIFNKYKTAWEDLDTKKLLEIFSQDATYRVKPYEDPYVGHEGIACYWDNVVSKKEKDVTFQVKSIRVHKNTAIVEWRTQFKKTKDESLIDLYGVIFADIEKTKIVRLWEYWHSHKRDM